MIQSIPLKKLVPSPRNVRKSSDVLADLQLRADIAARGLLQNLVVRKGKRGKFEVEAGGRRLAALLALAEEGTLPDTHEVTCLVIEGEESEVREASLAENFQRLAMNPADEAQAFAAIINAGATVEDVARRFGLTVRFVVPRECNCKAAAGLARILQFAISSESPSSATTGVIPVSLEQICSDELW